MKTNLSSQIKLDRIPRRYYAPTGEIELAALTREEKTYTRIFENSTEGSKYLAIHIVERIEKAIAEHGHCVIALGAGRGTHSVYKELIALYEKGKVSFENVIIFNLNEFFPLKADGPSTFKRLKEILFDQINVPAENLHTFNPGVTKDAMYDYCRSYEQEIEAAGGLDLTICEIGAMGSLGFNEPGSLSSTNCRLVLLSGETRQAIAKDYGVDEAPTSAITLGIGDIMRSSRVMAMAWGESRAKVVAEAIAGPVTEALPASFLQLHNHARIVLDLDSAEALTRLSMPWKVTTCEWTDKLIRRAIVTLSQAINKPILKLTDKDYKENGLNELVALYGSAYNVNIKVFNELQHTITGWPGGKPDADDTYRPERATPYPKRVIVFSPHPDDDVISMGGTLKRLVDQHHDVHVAYETSGNIAVGDEDMMRYFMMMDKIAPKFGFDTEGYEKLTREVREFVANKKDGEVDLPEIREIKTMIRQAEATIACNFIGVKPGNIHFLRLPFYETGTIKKGNKPDAAVTCCKNK
ncbi:MAG: 6-phosphogluconolactonase, partial [Muribaculaceae bacterium]|nr:6-phosphogluconolactonase [Muribaculaceae bacterium]